MKGWKNRKTFSRDHWMNGIMLGHVTDDENRLWDVYMTADCAYHASLKFDYRGEDKSSLDSFIFPYQPTCFTLLLDMDECMALGKKFIMSRKGNMILFPLCGIGRRRQNENYYDEEWERNPTNAVAKEFYIDISVNFRIFNQWALEKFSG